MRERVAGGAGWLLGPLWIAAMRARYGRGRRVLTARERERMAPYFDARLLEGVRVAEVERIELWVSRGIGRWVQGAVGRRGGRVAASPAGLTLGDLVLVSGGVADPESLLFHELVHVVQFEVLGLAGFAGRYLAEWAAGGGRVDAIPMERDAYELQARFDAGEVFSVREQVARRLSRRNERGA